MSRVEWSAAERRCVVSDPWGASWDEIGTVAAVTAAMYGSIVIAVRIAGRRTVSEMSAFDVVVTIAIGSMISTTVLGDGTTFASGMTAVVTLLLAQQIVALVRQRVSRAQRFLDFAPEEIYADGELNLRRSPLSAQLTEAELRSKLRQQGLRSLDQVQLVILEPDGSISVWRQDQDADDRSR